MLENIIAYITHISQGNEMIAGALTLALSGTVGWFLTALPKKIWYFLKVQMTTSMTFNNTDYAKSETFLCLLNSLQQLSTQAGSRTLSIDSKWEDSDRIMVITMGYGNHFFFYKKRLMWLDRQTLDSSGSERQKEQITIKVLGRSHKIFHKLVEENKPGENENEINLSNYEDGEWCVSNKIVKQGLDSLALDVEVKSDLRGKVSYFLNNEEEYRRLGLAYKMSIVLHGEPGSGKTSIIKGIASEYNMNLCNLPLQGLTDRGFFKAINEAPKRSIIVIEDFDSHKATHRRENVAGSTTSEQKETSIAESVVPALSLSGMLNTLDGISSLNGVIVILTTNCLDSIDDALLRPGRIDTILELPLISSQAVKEHFEKIYQCVIDFECPELAAKDVNKIVYAAKANKNKALELLEDKKIQLFKKRG